MLAFSRHPDGLRCLFFTELWERFSFYGLSAILVLYLVLPVDEGGLGYATDDAVVLYGNYAMAVYLLSVAGGFIADRWTGPDRAVLIGGVIITAGHALMALGHSAAALLTGLGFVAAGTGLLKPNISVLVGQLYAADDDRRDAGFSLFYMGINVGAFLAPLICGYLAQSDRFRDALAELGLDPRTSWHWGFGAAGVGMLLGLIVFVARRWPAIRAARPGTGWSRPVAPPSGWADLSRRFGVIAFFCACSILFFSVLQQAAASLNLFADRYTRTELFGWVFPSSWFQSVPALYVIVLAPLFSALWIRLGTRQPDSATKMVIGLFAAAAALAVMIPAAAAAQTAAVSPLWLLAVYGLIGIGEMCLSPVGLSSVTQIAPARLVGVAMGAWFVAAGLGGKLAGEFSAWLNLDAVDGLADAFARQAGLILVGALLLAGICRLIRDTARRLATTAPDPETPTALLAGDTP